MIPQDQEFLMTDDMPGDCARAVIASLLELPREQVPHFLLESDRSAYGFHTQIEMFLDNHGYDIIWGGSPIYHMKEGEDVYHYISGPSPRGGGAYHGVVGLNGNIIHDPHPSREGLLGTPKDWRYSFLVKK